IPAVVSSTDGSCTDGTSEPDGSLRWPRSSKNERNRSRISAAVMALESRPARGVAGRAIRATSPLRGPKPAPLAHLSSANLHIAWRRPLGSPLILTMEPGNGLGGASRRGARAPHPPDGHQRAAGHLALSCLLPPGPPGGGAA